uniref:BTB domain-containing protein n=1 Tax=Biomphalaria glabrata TaxID=6526 RepID=A0A2C9KHD8_BIOGL
MVIKREVAFGIVQGTADFWKCEELQDFTVTVGTTQFGCHRFLLAACSVFFRGLFRSGMKEAVLKCATVKYISKETFESILETLYTGHDVLSKDNVIDIWRAAHQLQIPFLIKECEEFAKATLSLDNYIEYYKIAKLFESKEVIKFVWSFILKNANSFFQTDFFYEMQVSDVLRLIQSQDLETTSEDDVVHALLKWVEFRPCQHDETLEDSVKEHKSNNLGQKRMRTDNDSFEASNLQQIMTIDSYDNVKKQHFSDLSNTRTCLLSTKCLEMLSCHPLVRESKIATDTIMESFLYQLQVSKRNGQWPPGAIYRNNGKYVNIAIAVCKNINQANIKVKAFSMSKQWLQLPDLPGQLFVTIVTIDKSIFAIRDLNTRSSINKEVLQLDPTTYTTIRMTDLPFTAAISHVTNYEQYFLVFYDMNNDQEEAAISCFDTTLNTWNRLDDLKGPAKGMTSFKHKYSTYLMQTNGNLWVVESQSKDVKLKFLTKFWSCDWSLHGAVTFNDEVYIYGVKSDVLKEDSEKQTSLEGIFSQIVYMESEDTAPWTFIPATLSRECFV